MNMQGLYNATFGSLTPFSGLRYSPMLWVRIAMQGT
jgi:hypothetical protein